MTSEQLLNLLNSDPNWVDMMKDKEKKIHEAGERITIAESSLVSDLNKTGLNVNSVWDLVNSKRIDYAPAVPILMKYLRQENYTEIRDGIARALAIPAANAFWDELVNLYRTEKNSRVRQGLAVAVANAASEKNLKEIMALCVDEDMGETRVILMGAFARFPSDFSFRAVSELKEIPIFNYEANKILKAKRWSRYH